VEGLTNCSITWNNNGAQGVTNRSVTAYAGGGNRYLTNFAPDNSYTVAAYQYGQWMSSTRYTNGTSIAQTTNGYDAHWRLSTVWDARTGTTTNWFNAMDEVSETATPAPGPGQSSQVTAYYFDNMGRVTNTILPDGMSVRNSFYPTGLTATNGGSRAYPVGYGYDGQGRMMKMTNWGQAGSEVTTWNYDANRGWLNSKKYADANGPSYTYTPAGRLASRSWARGTSTSYTNNAAGDVMAVRYSGSTAGVTNGYDRRGRLTAITNGATVTTLTLNDAGEVLLETNAGGVLGGLAVSNAYDGLLRRTNLTVLKSTTAILQSASSYDAASRLLTVSDGTNSATYFYLANSPLVDHITFARNGSNVMTTSNKFDNLNRLTAISSVASGTSVVNFQYQYNQANQRTAVTNADSTYWLYGYDSLGQVTNGVKKWGDNTVVAGQQFGFGFDTIGNRTMTLAGGDQSGANRRLASYGANSLNEYTSRTVPGAVDVIGSATNTALVWVNQMGAYRKTNYFWLALPIANNSGPAYQTVTTLATLPDGTSAEYGVTSIGHVFLPQTPESYGYDLDGNLTSDGRWTNTWDAENRLTNMTGLSSGPFGSLWKLDFTNDYMGRRIQKIVSTNNGSWVASYTNRFVYDGWNVVAILDGGNNRLYSFTWGMDLSGSMQGAGGVGGLLSMTVYSGTNAGSYLYCYDGNGNVAALVNAANGAIAAQYEYGPFGELIRATGPMAKVNPFLFSTKFYDWETGLYYYGYRYYNPSSGRWLSRDLAEEDGGLNLYAILGNDPVGDVDYLGLVDYKFDIVVGTPRTIGDVGEWGQPAKSATGSTNVSGKTATSSVTITSRTKPAHGSGSGACNTVDGGDWGQDVASRHDAGTINLYVRNDCPGYFDIFIDGSMQLTATGPYLAAPAASITDGNGRIQASGNGNVKKPFSLSTSFVVPLHLGSDWTLAATYDPKVTVGPDTGKKATGTATGSITFVDARPH
jgi:RHS repeat-associated protein